MHDERSLPSAEMHAHHDSINAPYLKDRGTDLSLSARTSWGLDSLNNGGKRQIWHTVELGLEGSPY